MDDLYTRYREALRNGHQLAAEGKFKDALGEYRQAAELAGDRALPHTYVGGTLLRMGRAKEALAAYDLALQREPDSLDALAGRASALLGAGKRDEAARVNERISQLRAEQEGPRAPAPETTPLSTADVLQAAGEAAREKGDNESAIDAWLEESREHARGRRLDAALDACLRALSLATGSARIHLELTRLYFQRGWHEQAAERALLIERLLSLEPDGDVTAGLRRLASEYVTADERMAGLLARHPGTVAEA